MVQTVHHERSLCVVYIWGCWEINRSNIKCWWGCNWQGPGSCSSIWCKGFESEKFLDYLAYLLSTSESCFKQAVSTSMHARGARQISVDFNTLWYKRCEWNVLIKAGVTICPLDFEWRGRGPERVNSLTFACLPQSNHKYMTSTGYWRTVSPTFGVC